MACGGRQTNYELIYVLFGIVLICVLTILGPFIQRTFDDLATNLALGEFETAFAAIQHPAGTERLAARKMAGTLAGGDKGCDFFVSQMRRYEESPEKIVAAYANQTVPKAGNLGLLFITNGAFEKPDLPGALSDLAEWNLAPDQMKQPLYLVYILALDYEGGGISGCH